MRRLAVALVFAIVLSVAVLPVFVSDVHASPDWLTGWSYRKSHVINNATGAGTNYQVKITADFGKKAAYDANTTLSTTYCHGLIYYNNYLYGCQRYSPGKVFKVSADLSSSLVVTVTRNGTEAGQLADIIQAGGYIWVGDSSGYLYKLSSSDLSTVNYYSVVSSVIHKICFDGTYIFGCTGNGEVFKFNVNTAEVTVQQIQSGNIFHSMVEDGSYLYVSDIVNYWIRKIAKSDLSQVSYVSVGYKLTDDMTQDATYIFGGIEESTGGMVRVQKSDLSVYTYRGSSFGKSYGVFSSGSYILNLDQAKGILWVHSCPDLTIVRKIYLESDINELAEDESYYYLSVYKTSETPLKKISKSKIYSLPGEVAGSDDLVYLDCKSKPDFGDLRFTKSDGVTLLDYWMETKVDGDYAIFWVEVADDLSSSSATIYVYYGKSSAISISNGENTFLFFDDFNSDLSKWTQRSGTWTISDGNLVSPMLDNSQIVTTSFSAYNVRIRSYFKITWVSAKNALAIIARTPDLSNLVKIQYQPGATSPEFNMFKRISGLWTKLDYEYVTADQNYHTYEFLLYGSSLKGYRDGTSEITGTESTLTSNPIGFRHGGSNADSRGYVDWVFAAKYVSPEPSHGSWGNEEVPPAEYSRSASQTLTFALSAERTPKFNRAGTQTLSLSLTADVLQTLSRAPNLNIAFSVVSSAFSALYRSTVQSLTLNLYASRTCAFQRLTSQSLSFTFDAIGQITGALIRYAYLTVNFAAESARQTLLVRGSFTSLAFDFSSQRLCYAARSATLAVTIITDAFKGVSKFVSLGLNFAYESSALQNLARQSLLSLQLTCSSSALQNLFRSASQSATFLFNAIGYIPGLIERAASLAINFVSGTVGFWVNPFYASKPDFHVAVALAALAFILAVAGLAIASERQRR